MKYYIRIYYRGGFSYFSTRSSKVTRHVYTV